MDEKLIQVLQALGLTDASEADIAEALKAAGVIIPAAEEVVPANGLAAARGLGLMAPAFGLTPGAWRATYTVEGPACPSVNAVTRECETPEEIPTGDPVWIDVDVKPVVLQTTLRCSTFGADPDEAVWVDRTRKRLDLCQYAALAHELWTGEASEDAGFGNKFLASVDAVEVVSGLSVTDYLDSLDGDPWPSMDIVTAIGKLEDRLSKCTCGAVHLIHTSPRNVSVMAQCGQIDRIGGRIFTKRGTLVIDDDGYPGTGPAGGPAATGDLNYLYGTSVLTGAIDTATTHPGSGTPGGWISTTENFLRYQAQRRAMVTWTCCHFVALVDVS